MCDRAEEAVSAADANRKFSQLPRNVREGHSYVVTTHGKPVAKIIPIGAHDEAAVGARAALLKRLHAEPVLKIRRWTRDELYEDAR